VLLAVGLALLKAGVVVVATVAISRLVAGRAGCGCGRAGAG